MKQNERRMKAMTRTSAAIAILCALILVLLSGVAYAQEQPPPPQPTGGEAAPGNVYFYLNGELAPVPRDVAGGGQGAEFALLELLKGPTEEEKAAGYITYIPEGVKLQYSTIKQDYSEYSVNLSRELLELSGDKDAAVKALAQIVKTLQDVTKIQNIGITVAGEEMGSPPQDAYVALGIAGEEGREPGESKASGGGKTALIIAIVLGVLILALLIFLTWYILARRKSTRAGSKSDKPEPGSDRGARKGARK
jgi:hypothetical protein